jgi:serine/threonine-protein kinase
MATVFQTGDRCGPYQILSLIGQGGMGEVHLARGPNGELRAVKVLSPQAVLKQELSERFTREVQVLSYLENAHVVRFYEAGVLDRGDGRQILWVALEYIQGRSLREILATSAGRIDQDKIVRWGRHVAQGVAEAHKLKVIHRDLKPENVIVASDDTAKVIDFGIAKFRDWGDKRNRKTDTTQVGTLLYMAPEQIDESQHALIDARCDVYALGVILYELACGKNPYFAEDGSCDMAGVWMRKLTQDLPPLHPRAPHLSADLAAIIDRACNHDPAKRFPNMGQLNDALASVRRRMMDERRGAMLGDADSSLEAPTAYHTSATVPAFATGQSAKFASVRTVSDLRLPAPGQPQRVWPMAVLGALLGIAAGYGVYMAAIDRLLGPVAVHSPAAQSQAPARPQPTAGSSAAESATGSEPQVSASAGPTASAEAIPAAPATATATTSASAAPSVSSPRTARPAAVATAAKPAPPAQPKKGVIGDAKIRF